MFKFVLLIYHINYRYFYNFKELFSLMVVGTHNHVFVPMPLKVLTWVCQFLFFSEPANPTTTHKLCVYINNILKTSGGLSLLVNGRITLGPRCFVPVKKNSPGELLARGRLVPCILCVLKVLNTLIWIK